KLRADITGIPSSGVRITSVASARIVRVIGTTMISLRESITSSRVRISTGRRLSGRANVYHRISPRLTQIPPSRLHPMQVIPHHLKTQQSWENETCRRLNQWHRLNALKAFHL